MSMKFRSDCPIASVLDVMGDRWSLVVIRSMMLGATSYGALLAAPERISTNILADRLRMLEARGLIKQLKAEPGSGARGAYALTKAGTELLPILQAAARWGENHLPRRWRVPEWFYSASPEDFRC